MERGGQEERFGLELVPDLVKQFVVYFYRHIRERNIREIYSMYEVSFAKLSERFFKNGPWPQVELIAGLVDNDHVFCLLYKEMYYRHLYATVQPTLQQRCESWDNYCALFRVILHGNVNMQLPNGWLWEMVDEFIYQFQSFAQYRGKPGGKSGEELDLLAKCEGVWDVEGVKSFLEALVVKSEIAKELGHEAGLARFLETEGYDPHSSNVLRMLGYFSLVGLLRVHSLVGDYEAALRALGPANPFHPRSLLTHKIAMCHITLYYYAGFCYLMLRRYLDAGVCFNSVLTYIARVKSFHQRNGAVYDQILKKNEQMYAMLAMTCSLCPAATRGLDEATSVALREKYGEKMHKMARGGESTYDELFSYACPKFIAAEPPSLTQQGVNSNQEAYRTQLRLFLTVIHEQRHLPNLKQFLKLYTSISLKKLASLMEMDEASVRTQLGLLKATTSCPTYPGKGDALSSVSQQAADIDFRIDEADGDEMIVVEDIKVQRRQGEFLARHIARFEEILRDLSLSATNPPTAPRPQAAY